MKTIRLHWIQFGTRTMPTPGYGIVSSSSIIPIEASLNFERQCNQLWPESEFKSSTINFALPIDTEWIVIGVANRSGIDHAGRPNAWTFSGLVVNSTWDNLKSIDPFLILEKADFVRDSDKKFLNIPISEISSNIKSVLLDDKVSDITQKFSCEEARILIQHIWKERPESFVLPFPENSPTRANYLFKLINTSPASFCLSKNSLDVERLCMINRAYSTIILIIALIITSFTIYFSYKERISHKKYQKQAEDKIQTFKEEKIESITRKAQLKEKNQDLEKKYKDLEDKYKEECNKNTDLNSVIEKQASALSKSRENADDQLRRENNELANDNAKDKNRLRQYHMDVDDALKSIDQARTRLMKLQGRDIDQAAEQH